MKCKKLTNEYLAQKLLGTTWIVPPQTLEAYLFTDDATQKVTDQTVWVINGYDKGYFFGDSYVALNGTDLIHTKMLGSITPLGDVLIAFYSGASNPISGFGKFDGKKFLMQMNTIGTISIAHWSYMVSVRPEDPWYRSLPGLRISVPNFIAQF